MGLPGLDDLLGSESPSADTGGKSLSVSGEVPGRLEGRVDVGAGASRQEEWYVLWSTLLDFLWAKSRRINTETAFCEG